MARPIVSGSPSLDPPSPSGRTEDLQAGPVPREKTRQVMVGSVPLGGGAPISVQSMTTTPTTNAQATLAQIADLKAAGCDIVRVAIPNEHSLKGFSAICAASSLPVVADIHFDHRLAIAASELGAAALRINPGNIGSFAKVDAVLEAAHRAHIPVRIGVNAGSLAYNVAERSDLTHEQKLIESAIAFVHHAWERGFYDLVLSAKTHSVPETLAINRRLSKALPSVPLHLGVTEAGGFCQATVKNAIALGALLTEGIGDTLRVSITAPPQEEVTVAWHILQALGLRRRGVEVVSCPTCARCSVDLLTLATQLEERLRGLALPITVAVMGCEVNGPGEAREADIGVAFGKGRGTLFAAGEPFAVADEAVVGEVLLTEISQRFASSNSEAPPYNSSEPQ